MDPLFGDKFMDFLIFKDVLDEIKAEENEKDEELFGFDKDTDEDDL